jgi:hypothetical protein
MHDLVKSIVASLRTQANAWYENATVPGKLRILNPLLGQQAMGELRSLGCDLPEGSVTETWSTWCREYATLLRRNHAARQCELVNRISRNNDDNGKGDGLESGTLLLGDERKCRHGRTGGKCLRADPVSIHSSPEGRLSASIDKSLQVVEMFLLFCQLQPDCPRLPPVEVWSRLQVGLTALYILGHAESFLKLKLATLDAYSKRQHELPPVGAPFLERQIRSRRLLPGASGLTLGNWLLRTMARGQHFVFWMKRGAPRVSTEQIAAQERASFRILQTPHEPKGAVFVLPHGEVRVTEEDLVREVTRTAIELFRPYGKRHVWPDEQKFHLPSNHAHFGMGRSKGGARGKIAAQQPAPTSFLDSLQRSIGSLGSRDELPRTRKQWIDAAMEWHPLCSRVRSMTNLRPPNEMLDDGSPAVLHWFEVAFHEWSCRDVIRHAPPEEGKLDAKIIGLAEPLKVRTITAGPENAYYLASFIQKFLHGRLRHHEAFRLIGKPLELVDINRTFHRPLRTGEFLVSGDYKSATDLISARLSATAAETIAEETGMPPHVADVFLRSLVGHTLHCGDEEAPQQNGQLMGSPTSFPILCLINAAVTRFSLELRQGCVGQMDLLSFPLLINGDDVGFVTDQLGYEIWKVVTRMGGLVFSVGKNFTSPDFLVLNSTMFEIRGRSVPRPMAESGTRRRVASLSQGPPTYASLSSVPNAPCNRWWELEQARSAWRQRDRSFEWEETTTLRDRELVFFANDSKYVHLMPCPFRPTAECASLRNNFCVSPWQNPDYLGPVGRYVPTDSKTCPLLALPAFQRYRELHNIHGLFQPEGYAILPGLQQAWLAGVQGPRRHELNQLFVRSWGPVLKLAQGPGWTTDWWLPTHLGGVGLENTDPDRSLKSSSRAALCLAKYLLLHPERVPIALPSISIDGHEKDLLLSFLDHYEPLMIRGDAPLPHGCISHEDLLNHASRAAWLSTFQQEREGPLWSRGFGDDEDDDGRRMVLAGLILKFRESRTRLWHSSRAGTSKNKKPPTWLATEPITPEELAASLPPQRVYRLSDVSVPLVDLSEDRLYAPERYLSVHGNGFMPVGMLVPHEPVATTIPVAGFRWFVEKNRMSLLSRFGGGEQEIAELSSQAPPSQPQGAVVGATGV